LEKRGFRKMAEAILEKIPFKRRWEIATQSYNSGCMGYIQVLLGIIGKEKLAEIQSKMWGEGMKTVFPNFMEEFKIPVEDAVDAANLTGAITILTLGPECKVERIEETANRVVERWIKCPWWESAKEFGITGQYDCTCSAWTKEGLKAINPKLSVRLTKARPRGDPYCEYVYELKE
jgi:hypothetical protein